VNGCLSRGTNDKLRNRPRPLQRKRWKNISSNAAATGIKGSWLGCCPEQGNSSGSEVSSDGYIHSSVRRGHITAVWANQVTASANFFEVLSFYASHMKIGPLPSRFHILRTHMCITPISENSAMPSAGQYPVERQRQLQQRWERLLRANPAGEKLDSKTPLRTKQLTYASRSKAFASTTRMLGGVRNSTSR